MIKSITRQDAVVTNFCYSSTKNLSELSSDDFKISIGEKPSSSFANLSGNVTPGSPYSKNLVYTEIKNMFYNNYNNSYNIFGITGFDTSKVSLNLADTFIAIDFPPTTAGDGIRKKSVNIEQWNGDIVTHIIDDGNHNLILSGSFFVDKQDILSNTENVNKIIGLEGLSKFLYDSANKSPNEKSIFPIYNEGFGRSVDVYGDFAAIGNINSYDYSKREGVKRIGEITVYKKEISNNNDYTPFHTYLPEPIPNCQIVQSKLGNSIALYDTILVAGDYDCKYYTNITSDGNLSETSDLKTIRKVVVYPNIAQNSNWSISITPPHILSENHLFGYSVAISDSYIIIGAPYNQLSDDDEKKPGYVFVYPYSFINGTFTIYNTNSPIFTISNVSDVNNSEPSFGYCVSTIKSNPDNILKSINEKSSKVLISSHMIDNDNNEIGVVRLYSIYNKMITEEQIFKPVLSGNSFDFQIDEVIPNVSFSGFNFGISSAITSTSIVIGNPTEISYTETSVSSDSPENLSTIHNRGACYFYSRNSITNVYDAFRNLSNDLNVSDGKIYGGSNTFKDNFFGCSVDIVQFIDNSSTFDRFVVGSPRRVNDTMAVNSIFLCQTSPLSFQAYSNSTDINENAFNGQCVVYETTLGGNCGFDKSLIYSTNYPVTSYKNINESYNSFGASVAISNRSIIVGAPVVLFSDTNLNSPLEENLGNLPDSQSFFQDFLANADSPADAASNYISSSVLLRAYPNNQSSSTDNYLYAIEHGRNSAIQGHAFIYDMSDYYTNYVVGNVFYNYNKIIINASNNCIFGKKFVSDISNYNSLNFKGSIGTTLNLHEKQYICTVKPGEFNISTNTTAKISSPFEYSITNSYMFTFKDLDYILRYIIKVILFKNSEAWWLPQFNIISPESEDSGTEQSIFNFYSSSENYPFSENYNILTNDVINKIKSFDLDVDDNNVVNTNDAKFIWQYFAGVLNVNSYKNLLDYPDSRRTSYDDIIGFLDQKTGKHLSQQIIPEFFDFEYNSSVDPTGSYLAPYITSVGLYNNADLIALAKLSSPVKNTGELPLNFAVKFDI